MVKIRLSGEEAQEVEAAVSLMEGLFPEMRFSAVRLGGNPKYANDPKYFSYGEPRISNKRPVKVDFADRAKQVQKAIGAGTTKRLK